MAFKIKDLMINIAPSGREDANLNLLGCSTCPAKRTDFVPDGEDDSEDSGELLAVKGQLFAELAAIN